MMDLKEQQDRFDAYAHMYTWLSRFEQVEFYFIPACFILGLVGNLVGAACIFSYRSFRRKTPLFILAACGLSDSALLGAVMQQWLAKFVSAETYLVTNSLCKFYFMLTRLSVIISASLVFVLLLSRVVSVCSGTYRLSVYSNLGQALSRLAVIYVIAISMSLSWHELWTSGLKWHNFTIIDDEQYPDYHSDPSFVKQSMFENLKSEGPKSDNFSLSCRKNVIESQLITVVHLVYFAIVFCVYLLLLVMSNLVWLRLKNVKLCAELFETDSEQNEHIDFIETDKLHGSSISLPGSKRASRQHQINKQPIATEPSSSVVPNETAKSPDLKTVQKTLSNLDQILNAEIVATKAEAESNEITTNNNQNETANPPSTTPRPPRPPGLPRLTPSWNKNSFYRDDPYSPSLAFSKRASVKNKPRHFTRYVLVISFLTALFSLPYSIFDCFIYSSVEYVKLKDMRSIYSRRPNISGMGGINPSVLESEEAKLRALIVDGLKRLPLLLILIPHSLKFYLLFIYYARFRLGLSRFLKIRFYINMDYLLSSTRRSTRAFRKVSTNPSSVTASETTSLSLRPRFKPISCCCCNLFSKMKTNKKTSNTTNNREQIGSQPRERDGSKLKNLNDLDDFVFGNEDFTVDDEESSSIAGFHCYYSDRSRSIRNYSYFYDFYADNNYKNNDNSPKTDSSPEIIMKNTSASNSISTNTNIIRLGSLLPREATV